MPASKFLHFDLSRKCRIFLHEDEYSPITLILQSDGSHFKFSYHYYKKFLSDVLKEIQAYVQINSRCVIKVLKGE